MATELSVNVNVAIQWTYRNDPTGNGWWISDSNIMSIVMALVDGTGLDQADKPFFDAGTLADAAVLAYDLSGGVLDGFGDTITMNTIKIIALKNKTLTAGANLILGGGSNPVDTLWGTATDSLILGPGGFLLLGNPSAAGYALTDTTADVLTLTADGAAIDYEIAIFGASPPA